MARGNAETKIIASAELSAYERWELPSVEAGAQPGSSPSPTEASPPYDRVEIEAELEMEREAVREQGFAAGLAAGREAAAAEAEQVIDVLRNGIDRLTAPLDALDREIEDFLVRISVAIARQIIGRELSVDPKAIASIVDRALQSLPPGQDGRDVRIKVSPSDEAALTRALTEASKSALVRMVESDPEIAPGGCEVISKDCRVDANLDARIATIAAHVFAAPSGTPNRDIATTDDSCIDPGVST